MTERPLSEWMQAVQMNGKGGVVMIDPSTFAQATKDALALEAKITRLRTVTEALIFDSLPLEEGKGFHCAHCRDYGDEEGQRYAETRKAIEHGPLCPVLEAARTVWPDLSFAVREVPGGD